MWSRLTAAVLSISTPLVTVAIPVAAQQRFQLNATQLQSGSVIPVSVIDTAGTQYYYPDTVYDVTMTVDSNVFNSAGQIVIPAGARVQGTMQPADGGSRFVASTLIFQDVSYPIQASSDVLNDVKDPRQYSGESIAEDAAIGAAAGAVIGAVTGGIGAGAILGGAGAGTAIGNVTAPRVVVLQPNQIVDVVLQDTLVL